MGPGLSFSVFLIISRQLGTQRQDVCVSQDVLKWQHQAKAAESAPGSRSDGAVLFQDSHF